MGNTEKIEPYLRKIVDAVHPKKIILFGSRAWGVPDEASDFDLLIIKETSESPRRVAREIDTAVFERDVAIDVLVYTPAYLQERLQLGDPFVQQIVDEGVVLYDSNAPAAR